MKKNLQEILQLTIGNLKALLKWIVVSLLTGVFCGLIGTLFHKSVEYVTELRGEFPWLLFLLPVFGLLINGI